MHFFKGLVLIVLLHSSKILGQTDSCNSLRWGTITPRVRYFFMHTQNDGVLSDYFANALGVGIKCATKSYKNFHFVLNGSITGNVYSSDFSVHDPLTQQINRYEQSLMDVVHPSNKIIPRLDEFYLSYNRKILSFTIGKQHITTPFINAQDGRMNTTSVEGFWTKISPTTHLELSFGYLYKIAPRSTGDWYNIGASIGIYPTGVTPLGEKSSYSNHTHSDGILVLGSVVKPIPQFELKFWNYTILNVFNLVLLQPEYHLPINEIQSFQVGAQFVYENTIGNGGNATPTFAYFQKNQQTGSIGSKINWKRKKTDISINYNYIFNQDRFAFPREWGREPFFTFLPRERMEGTAESHAIAIKTETSLQKHWNIALGIGYYSYANVSNYAKNKYGMPSFVQLNSELKYTLKNLDILLLHCLKLSNDKSINNTKYELNKVNLSQINLVLNYHL